MTNVIAATAAIVRLRTFTSKFGSRHSACRKHTSSRCAEQSDPPGRAAASNLNIAAKGNLIFVQSTRKRDRSIAIWADNPKDDRRTVDSAVEDFQLLSGRHDRACDCATCHCQRNAVFDGCARENSLPLSAESIAR